MHDDPLSSSKNLHNFEGFSIKIFSRFCTKHCSVFFFTKKTGRGNSPSCFRKKVILSIFLEIFLCKTDKFPNSLVAVAVFRPLQFDVSFAVDILDVQQFDPLHIHRLSADETDAHSSLNQRKHHIGGIALKRNIAVDAGFPAEGVGQLAKIIVGAPLNKVFILIKNMSNDCEEKAIKIIKTIFTLVGLKMCEKP